MWFNKAGCQNAVQVGRKPRGPVEEGSNGRNEAFSNTPAILRKKLNPVQKMKIFLLFFIHKPTEPYHDDVLNDFREDLWQPK